MRGGSGVRLGSVRDLELYREGLRVGGVGGGVYVSVCGGSGCLALGGERVAEALRRELGRVGGGVRVELKLTGCHGFCERGPLVVVHPYGYFYSRVREEDAEEIVERTVLGGGVVERLLYVDPVSGERVEREGEVPFYRYQRREVLGWNGMIDPLSVDDYIRLGGYSALGRVLGGMSPEEVIGEVERAGLRGRGGGGFPTGRKWRTCRGAEGEVKYVIINADEGDPGAYMDRSLLEGNPHLVLEGLIIGAYAIGSHEGYIYVRHEYPLALRNFRVALGEARRLGLLGRDILGSGFDFEVRVNQGGGAFVCGESSALMASIEGRVGEPRAKYVHTVERGIYDRPSNLNNVETWANVPIIINKGADWYRGIGTEGSKGTKIFSLVGKVNNTGLVEVPMGVSLREIIFNIGGGIPKGKRFKAVQTGGPSGGCLPEGLLDLPVDFDRLTEVGSMMGSGGMIVMDEDTCMVDVARYFLNFLREESCGKCTPCREGIKQMLGILNRVVEGKGEEGDVELLQEIAGAVVDGSLCALGGSAPNPVLSTIRYFREEYEAHIRERRCPAGVCRALLRFSIDPEKCTGCMVCARNCPAGAIRGEKKKVHVIDPEKCTRCGICWEGCKFGAVVKK